MKKQLLLIGLALTVVNVSAAEKSTFPKFILNKFNKPKANVQKTMTTHEGYANFSGHWVGTCDYDPGKVESTIIEQEQDGSSIVMDNIEIPIDGITSHGFNGNFDTEKSIVHYRWNEDGQKILGTALFYDKAGNMSQGGVTIAVAKFDFSIDNGQLVTSYAISSFID